MQPLTVSQTGDLPAPSPEEFGPLNWGHYRLVPSSSAGFQGTRFRVQIKCWNWKSWPAEL